MNSQKDVDEVRKIVKASLEKEQEETPLLYYVRVNNLEKIKALLENGANPDQRGGDFRNPLALALILRHIEAVRLLLQYGADSTELCAREPLIFHAPIYSKNKTEKMWIYNKKMYDLLKEFNVDFSIKKGKLTLEEYFKKCLPSEEFLNVFR